MSRPRATADDEMDEEMRLHLDLLTERNVAAGMAPAAARRAALLAFGPAEALKEAARAQRPFAWLADLGRDLAFGARLLDRDRGFAAAAVLTLGLGIGACVAIFSVVNAVLLRPLPYPEPERLVVLTQTNLPRFPELVVLPEQFGEWRRQARSFEGLAAVRTRSYNLTGTGEPVRVAAARLTAETLSLLRVRPALGRDFLPEEEVPGKGNVAVVSHAFWQRQLGGRPDVLGATLRLDGEPFAIVGVMPEGFALDEPLDLFTPAAYLADDPQNRRSLGARALQVIGRLRPGVTVDEARAEMAVVADRLSARHGGGVAGGRWGVKVTPLLESRVGDTRPLLLSLLGAVLFLLVIACANVANLQLARATARAREMAMRAALGATPGRIVRQLLAESLLLAAGGGLVGVLLARAGTAALVALAPASLPRAAEIAVDGRALGFACALVLLAAVGFGLAPAWGAARLSLVGALKEGGRGAGAGRARRRVLGGLVVAEVAVALVLLAGAGLLIRSFARMAGVDRGFGARGALTFDVSLARGRYGGDAALAAYAGRAAERLAAIPGVTAAGATQSLPFTVDLNIVFFQIAGRPAVAEPPTTYVFEVTPGYFRAMGIPLLRGRLLDERDVAGRPIVAVINQAMARRYFPDEDPIGKRIGRPDMPPEKWGEIVGVVADVKDGRVYALGGAGAMQTYVPFSQSPYDVLSFVVRGGSPAAVRAAMADVDPDQPITSVRPLDDLVAESVGRPRFAMLLFAVFSAAALLLAAVGITGVMAYAVARRTGEIGVRMALGARAGDVVRLVLAQGGRLVALGIAAGLAGALLTTRLLASLLFEVGPRDPLTLAAIVALLAAVALLACLLPARRATRIDPMRALRVD